MKKITITLAIGAIFVVSGHGQSFQNLDFESAQNLPGNPGNGVLVSVTSAMPGWSAYDGSLALSDIYYVSNTLGNVSSSVELEGGSLALSGDFSVELFGISSISQTGFVPAGTESLELEAEGPGAGGAFGVSGFGATLGGQTLSLSVLSQGPAYVVYGANIPAGLAGQTEALTLGCQGNGSGNVLLDSIEFSTSSVPEPGECGLVGLGVVLFGFCRKHLTAKNA